MGMSRSSTVHARSVCLLTPHRRSYNAILSFTDAEWILDTFDLLPEGVQPQITVEELIDCEKVVRNDARVQKLAKDVGEFFYYLNHTK